MSASLPEIPLLRFGESVRRLSPEPLADAAILALHRHYEELRRWNPRLSLVGPGTVDEVLGRHYGESLAALSATPVSGTLLDVGSGAGFPGLAIAAARPALRVLLAETRERKRAFLAQAARRAALAAQPLDARVDLPLPASLPGRFDVVTSRAVALAPRVLAALAERMAPGGRFLLWVGVTPPELPAGWSVARQMALLGSEQRRILVVERQGPG